MRHLPLAALLILLAPSTLLAQSNALDLGTSRPPLPPLQATDVAPGPTVVPVVDDRVAFNTTEQWLIPFYFQKVRGQQQRAARSKTYDRALPAGLTQEPVKGDRLPPTVLAKLSPLPGPLLRSLPPARPGTDRVVVGKNVLMVTTDGLVLDILSGIIS